MRRRFRVAVTTVSVLILILSMTPAVSAASPDVDVYVLGDRFAKDDCVLVDSVTRVPFRAFCRDVTGGEAEVSWDPDTETAVALWRGRKITARLGEPYIIANGRYIWCGVDNYIEGGTMMVAVRPMAKAFSMEVLWDGDTYRVSVSGDVSAIESGDDFYDKWELYWLSRIISAESRGEPLFGKVAVGTVIYNRACADEYPDNIYDVIFDMKHGIQFTPAYTGSVYKEPTEESVVAAKLCMDGCRVNSDMIYFCTEDIRYTSWAGRNRPYVMTIGNHVFFA